MNQADLTKLIAD
jgi:hypothetical protein